MSIAEKIELADFLMKRKYIKTPDEYFDIINNGKKSKAYLRYKRK